MGIVWEGGFKGVGREGARVTGWMRSEYITCVEMSWYKSLLDSLDANETEMDRKYISVTKRLSIWRWQNAYASKSVLNWSMKTRPSTSAFSQPNKARQCLSGRNGIEPLLLGNSVKSLIMSCHTASTFPMKFIKLTNFCNKMSFLWAIFC